MELLRKDWVQLDAPRHYLIHSVKSLGILADKTGFVVEHVTFDRTGFQFQGSEQYRQDVSLHDQRAQSLFSASDVQKLGQHAAELNDKGQGDQAAFVLRKSRTSG